MSVEDKLEESRLGPQTITTKVEVLIWVSAYNSEVKSVYKKDESSPNLVSIKNSTNNVQGHMTAR